MASNTDTATKKKTGISPKGIAGIVAAVLMVITLARNSEPTVVHILTLSVTLPLWLWLLIFAVLGAIVGSAAKALRSRGKG